MKVPLASVADVGYGIGVLSPRVLPIITAGLLCLLPGCRSVSGAWSERLDQMAASNHMMLVRENPPSLGYRRLQAKARRLEDLSIFIERAGLPDFLAEAATGHRDYLIFYYVDRRHAFACRTRTGGDGALEFTGPYPISDGEVKLLDTARGRSETGLAGR